MRLASREHGYTAAAPANQVIFCRLSSRVRARTAAVIRFSQHARELKG
jgi:hypothetical protein